jgi:hypothetical protein
MPSRLEVLHQEAKDLFLGKGAVVGIGIANDSGHGELAFLLSEDRQQTRAEIAAWATRKDVGVQFLVAGVIRIGDSREGGI